MTNFSHGSRGRLFIDSAAGVETEVSSYITETGLSNELDVADVSALGDNHKKSITGLADGGFELSGHFDPTAAALFIDLTRAGQTGGVGTQFKYFPQGSASGKVYFDGTAICTSFSTTTGIGDAAAFTSAFKVNGEPTFGTA